MLFDVAREASAREEIGTKGVDRKELPYDLYDVLFAAKIVAKPFGDIAPGDFGDRRGAAFQNGEARFTEMDAQKTRNLAKLPLGLAGECLAGAIAFFKLPVAPLPRVDFPTINESVPSCLAFVNAESQLWNIWTIENNGDKSIENAQRDEIATKDFLRWYRYRGHRELLESGERCAVGMRMKYGRLQGWRARTYVAEAQQRQADFFVREMANECGEENLFPDEAQERAISHSLPRATPLMIPPGYRVPLFSVY